MSWRLLHGDFGVSLVDQRTGLTEFFTLFPATLELSFFAMLFAMCSASRAGVIAAVKRGGIYDQALMGDFADRLSRCRSSGGACCSSVRLGAAGLDARSRGASTSSTISSRYRLHADRRLLSGQPGAFRSALRHLDPAGDRARHRAARDVRAHDPLVDARGAQRGLRPHRARQGAQPCRVVGVHALRNALIPVVTVIGLQAATLLAGRGADGVHLLLAGRRQMADRSIARRDYPALQGGILLISCVVIIVNLERRSPLRHRSIRGSVMPADITIAGHHRTSRGTRRVRSRSGPRSLENRGAVARRVILGLPSSSSPSSRTSSRRIRRSSSIATSSRCRRPGTRAATGASCSAPTRSAATCFRA